MDYILHQISKYPGQAVTLILDLSFVVRLTALSPVVLIVAVVVPVLIDQFAVTARLPIRKVSCVVVPLFD